MNSTELNLVRMDHTSRYDHNLDDPWPAFLNGDDQAHQTAREALFHAHSNLAEAMAAKYARVTPAHKVDPEDLRAASYEGLLHALDNFDPNEVITEGTMDQVFRRYASRCIFGFLISEMHTQDTLPRNLSDQVREFRRQAEELAQLMGRCPTGQELREAFGCRDEQRFQLLESLADYQVNQEQLDREEGGPDEPEGMEDWTITCAIAATEGRDPITSNDPYESTVKRMFQDNLHEAIKSLPVLAQQIIHVRYGEGESLAQMSRDIGISRQTLSMHHTRALDHLRETLLDQGYGPDAVPNEWR